MQNEFFNRIIYKKNVIDDFKKEILANFKNSKVLIISSSSAKVLILNEIINSLNIAGCAFKIFNLSSKQNANINIVKEILIDKTKGFNLVCGIGSGNCSDITKVVAEKLDVQTFFFPTSASSLSYFNNLAYIENNGVRIKCYCKYFQKIFIDENILTSISKDIEKNSIDYINSYSSILTEIGFAEKIFGTHYDISNVNIYKMFISFKREMYFISDDYERRLKIMDYLVDLAYFHYFNKIEDNTMLYYTFVLEKILKDRLVLNKTTFSKLCLVSNKILMVFYERFFSLKNIFPFNIVQYQKKIITINKYSFNNHFDFNSSFMYYLTNESFYKKLNAEKYNLLKLCTTYNFSPYKNHNIDFNLNISDYMNLMAILPYIYKCGLLINLINFVGLL